MVNGVFGGGGRRFVAPLVVTLALIPGPASAESIPGISSTDAREAYGAAAPRAVAVYDPAEQRFLLRHKADEAIPVASLMKMVTALVVAERAAPDEVVKISARAAAAKHDRLRWRQGAAFTVNEVLHGMLMESSNGAAIALAEHVGGSVASFTLLARQRLAQLGATDTRIVDPSGLDASGQHSTARDMALVAAAVLSNEWLAEIVSTRSFTLPWPDGGEATFGNINEYLSRDPTAVGVKNGFTSTAGNTLAVASTRRGRTHIVIVLHSGEIYDTAKRLMDLAFEAAPGTGSETPLVQTTALAKQEENLVPGRDVEADDSNALASTTAPASKKSRGGPLKVTMVGMIVLSFLRLRKMERAQRRFRRQRSVSDDDIEDTADEPYAYDDAYEEGYEVADPWGEVLTYADIADEMNARASRRRISSF